MQRAAQSGISRNAGCVALLLIVALLAQGVTATTDHYVGLSQDLVTSNGTRAVYAMINGVPHWRLFPHLWVDKSVRLHWAHGKVDFSMSRPDACLPCSADTSHTCPTAAYHGITMSCGSATPKPK